MSLMTLLSADLQGMLARVTRSVRSKQKNTLCVWIKQAKILYLAPSTPTEETQLSYTLNQDTL